jgi:hypothetical protein
MNWNTPFNDFSPPGWESDPRGFTTNVDRMWVYKWMKLMSQRLVETFEVIEQHDAMLGLQGNLIKNLMKEIENMRYANAASRDDVPRKFDIKMSKDTEEASNTIDIEVDLED